jgi:4a-hydroxytetrahydrobiopterin dehydratase
MEKMSDAQVTDALKSAPEWSLVGEAIQRTFQFKDFVVAMRFVNAVAEAAEAAQHHPDILIRYSRVTLTLATHDAGGITGKDFDLARKADVFYGPMAPPPPSKPAKVEARKRSKHPG